MNEFVLFARSVGILIDSPPPLGVWRRYPTTDHPRSRNGAVKWLGNVGYVQNWATDQEVHVWKGQSDVDLSRATRIAQDATLKKQRAQEMAARKAASILKQCQMGGHPYLEKKGFGAESGNIFQTESGRVLVIPMRVAGRLVGAQMIDEEGEKKFLFGQRSADAEYVIDNKGPHVLVEGYATGLSVRAALAALKRRYTLHICFSAGNLVRVAKHLPRGFVVADHDKSGAGESAARETGWPYFLPQEQGQDFNDLHLSRGLFAASMALRSMPHR